MTNLLLVDDEVGTLMAYKKLLQSGKLHVDTATSMEEATGRLQKENYQIVISDLRLSGTLGNEGLEILKFAKMQNPGTVVILITAYGTSEVRNQAKSLGASFYFEKPVVADDLRSAISNSGVEL